MPSGTWTVEFGETRDGVLVVFHSKNFRNLRGRAYEYSSDSETLRLGAETSPGDINDFQVGGFECRRNEPATYAWLLEGKTGTLRLNATKEPCAARRAILEGDWIFYD